MKKLILLIMSALLICLNVPVYALSVDSIDVDADTQYVTISGTVSGKTQGVSIEVLRPEKTWAAVDACQPADIMSVLAFFYQAEVDGNGKYEVKYLASGDSGHYKVRVCTSGGDIIYHDGVHYYSHDDISDALDAVNAAKASDTLLAAAEGGSATLGIDTTLYENLPEKGKINVWENVLNKKSGDFDTVGEFISAYEYGLLLARINFAGSSGAMKALISAHVDDLDIEKSNSYDIYTDTKYYGDAKKESVCKILSEKQNYKSLEDFAEMFWDTVILVGCNNNSNWNTVSAIIEMSDRLLGADIGNYNSLKDKSTVCKTINSTSTVYSSINALAAAIKSLSSSNDKPGISNPGNGGPTRTSEYAAPIVPLDEKKDNEGIEEKQNVFSDIGSVGWAKEAINGLHERGIVTGRGAGVFDPSNNVTREEFVKMLVLALDIYNANAISEFADVPEGNWSCAYIGSAVQSGIVSGLDESHFGFGRNITRQEMAVMVYRAVTKLQLGINADGSPPPFADDDRVAEWAVEAVRYMQGTGLISGVGDNLFAPEENLTRAQAAKIVYELVVKRG